MQYLVRFGLLFGILGLSIAMPDSTRAAGSVSIVLSPQSSVVQVGDTFTVQVVVQAGDQELNTVEVYLDFDPSLLQASPSTDGGAFSLVLENSVDNSLGQIDFAAGTLGGGALPSGSFVLATLNLRAIGATPATPLSFSDVLPRQTDALYGAGISALGHAIDGSVEIQSENIYYLYIPLVLAAYETGSR